MLLESAALLLQIVVSVLLLAPMVKAARRERMLAGWPRATGVVRSHQVIDRPEMVRAEFVVTFTHGGQEFTTRCGGHDRTGYTPTRAGSARLKQVLDRAFAKHPVNSRVEVMVNPADPAEAYLAPRFLPLTLLASIAGAVLLAFLIATIAFVFVLPLLHPAPTLP